MSDNDAYGFSSLSAKGLANMLQTEGPRRLAAEAELRVREHRAIVAQADFAERAAQAAERQATAAERTTRATVVYVRLTFGLLVFTALAALATLAAWQQSCVGGTARPDSSTGRPVATH
jgi:hypothetical protein